MGASGPLLQIIQPAAPRHAPLNSVIHKIKQPPQILPKPPQATHQLNHINFKQNNSTSAAAHQNALLFNQMQLQGHHGQVPMLVQQQTSTSSASSGVQLILRSPSPQQQKQNQQHAQQQVMRLISSGSLQLQQIQTSSGPTFIAVPTQAALHPAQQHPQPATSPKKVKQTKAKKKRDDEQGSRLDLANLMRISGIEEEDVTPSSVVVPPPPPPTPTPSPKAMPACPSPQPQHTLQLPTSAGVSVSSGNPGLPQGFRLSLSEDGRSMVVTQGGTAAPQGPPVTASVAATAQAQLSELLAQHGSNILQNSGATFINTAGQAGSSKQEASLLQSLQVLSWSSGSAESVVMKSTGNPAGLTLGTPGVVIRHPTQGLVLNDPRYITTTDLSRVQLVTNTGTHDAPRYQLVTSTPLNNLTNITATEQNRQVHFVTNMPSQPSQQQHRLIEEQHQSSTTSHHQQTSSGGATGQSTATSFNKVHVVNEQQQRLHITSTLLEQQRVEILNEDQKVQLTSLLSTEQQKHITNLINTEQQKLLLNSEQQKIQLSMGPTSENIVMLNQQETKLTQQQPTEQKIVINADGTVNQQASIDLVNFQKNNLLNQKILINNESTLMNNQQLLNDALNQNNLLANQKMLINNAESAGMLTQRIELSQHNTNHIPAASTNQIITNHIPSVSTNQIIINNNGTLMNTTGGSVDLKEFLSSQKLLNNIAIHTTSSQDKQNHVLINNSDSFADQSGGVKVKEENVSSFQIVNNVQKSEQQTQQVNSSSQPRKERTKTKTFNDVYTEHLQQQVNYQQQQPMTPVTSQYNSFSIEQKPSMIYISNNDQQQQQHSPQSQQSQNKFLEQQHVNNIVFNTNHSNNSTLTTTTSCTPPPPSPSPSPTQMSFIPSKTLVNGSPVINDHTNRLQIVMDKPPTPTSGHYQETPTNTAHSQPHSQLLANKTQLQIVMDSQDHSQIALNDHQNRLQIVMNQPSPESVLISQPSPLQITPTSIQSPLQITPTSIQSPLQITSSGLQITPSSLQSIQNSLQMTSSGLQITPSPLQITPTSLQAPLTRLNGSNSATHVQFVSPRTINTVIKTSQPQPTPLVNSTPLIPTSQSHPQLSLQPSSNPGSTEHKSPSFTSQTNTSYNGSTPISQSNTSYNGSTTQSSSCYTPGSTPPVFVNRPNLTVVTQPHPPVLMSSDHNDSSQSQQVPFRSMPQVCDTSPPSVITQTPTNNVRPQMKPPTPQPRPLQPTSSAHSSSPPHSNINTTQFPSNSNNTHFSNNSSSGNTTHYNSSSSNAQNNAPYNSFLDTIAQQHPSILINKTLAPSSQPQPSNQPATSIIVKKPPVVKKSAVVKPMVMVAPNQEDGEPPSLVPLDGQNSNSVVQRVQTIQLTPQKQQHLKAVQNQITSLSAKDNKTSKDQATLQKLYKEQQSILLSGKIVPTIPGQHAQGLTFVSTPVRLVAPPTIPSPPTITQTPQTGGGKSTSPVCVQVGTQTSDDSKSPPPVIAAPVDPSPSPHVTSSTTLSLSKRAALIEQQQSRDILGATRPDTRTPFTSVSDAVKRLVRYHCLDDPVLSERDLSKADEIFEATAQHLLDKKAQMINKYKYLLIKESMRQVQTSELIMLGRMFVSDESAHLESLRQQAKNPPPTSTTTLVPSPCIDTPPSTTSPSTSPSSSSCLKRDRDVDSPLYSTRCEENGKRRCLGDDENETRRGECRDNEEEEDEDMDLNDDGDVKTPGRCAGDDDEIKAQVQSAIDSILNLQRSDPATDEAVRSILGTGVTS